ncbi:alpha-ketoglutarate-dependent dioxygenase AlkB [Croceitalea sp. MTPC9]|uniref:alpha-ketoglutarate-dependent dioxygenase AlkB family protein n=1 Tax=unclassified Croceitalea TaxID=2632280 RepID=UPI002B3EB57E|nr:alpha-ketoglutarate-dependent dioxygenase AlkB [Croceitalea sp. MTPC6]GMN17898.1 alpha-ketoglutarate-dependent dioxygenase AlkB [Croceitalea sp. MTPC9]
MAELFNEEIKFNLPNAVISYFPNFIENQKANSYFKNLKTTIPWQQDNIKVFGKIHPQPRLTALFGNNGKSYSYSNITMNPHSFTSELLELKEAIESISEISFTTCLLNLYRDGKDSNGWHSDDEAELGKNPVIASISLGQERFFHLRHKNDKRLRQKILLTHGSLLLMKGETQHFWQHQIPKTTRQIKERINLTFRVVY